MRCPKCGEIGAVVEETNVFRFCKNVTKSLELYGIEGIKMWKWRNKSICKPIDLLNVRRLGKGCE